jgi:A/G-specific adenine glycosylase
MSKKKDKKSFEKKTFSSYLLKWYNHNKRNLPWRNEKDPYKIWVSEIILQQTRVEQGLPYYLKFVKKFPDIKSLANATQDQVLKIWEGLGYYRRALHMHVAANQMLTRFKGTFPTEFEKILTLKGVGDYTASAIASIAFNEPKAVVDGNVIRVISRLFCVKEDTLKASVKNKIKKIANDLIDQSNPGDFNQAMMELGATVCLPRNPKCHECPVHQFCLAKKYNKSGQLPTKKSKVKTKERYLLYRAIQKNQKIFIVKRQNEDIWKGLYELPSIEFEDIKAFNVHLEKLKSEGRSVLGPIKHVLSHQVIFAGITKEKTLVDEPMYESFWVELTNLSKYPKPVLISKLLHLLYEDK